MADSKVDLNWLHDFECLARTLNFTRAAEERNITQSAFSRRIKALESWVGFPLVNRATYPIQITDAGRKFLPVALGAISQLAETREAIRDSEGGDNRFVRISVLHTISVNYLATRIESMQNIIPELRTRVLSDSLSSCCELLIEGAVDIMLCYDHASVSPRIDDAVFTRKNLLMERLVPVATCERVQNDGWDLSATKERAIPYLAYEQSSFLGMVVENTVGQKPMNVEAIYIDALVETIKRRLLQGSGFAWMPETAIATELADGTLVPIGDDTWCARLTISAFANPSSIAPQAQKFWDLL